MFLSKSSGGGHDEVWRFALATKTENCDQKRLCQLAVCFFFTTSMCPQNCLVSTFLLLTNSCCLPSVNGEVAVALFLEIFLAPPSKQANRKGTQPTSLSDK